MQRNRHISRRIHQLLHLFHIQGAIRFQDTYHDTLRSHFAEILYGIPYHRKFRICITEISKPRTDQRMNPDIRTLPYFLKKPWAGSCSPDDQIAAKLQSVRTTLGCCHGGFHRIHTGFQNIVFHVKITPLLLSAQSNFTPVFLSMFTMVSSGNSSVMIPLISSKCVYL